MCSISLQTCVLIILVVSVNGDWEKIGERIYNKISKFLSREKLLSCSEFISSCNEIHFNFRKWNRTQH